MHEVELLLFFAGLPQLENVQLELLAHGLYAFHPDASLCNLLFAEVYQSTVPCQYFEMVELEIELLRVLFVLEPALELVLAHVWEVASECYDANHRGLHELGREEKLHLRKVSATIRCQVEHL